MDDQSTAAVLTVSKNTTYAGAGTALYGGWFNNETAIAFGMVLGLAGLVINWFYQNRHYKLQKLESEAKIQAIKDQASEGPEK